jgi:hypothetical protein
MSELTGTPMAKVVNVLILLLIFVFDPLAVALVLMTNRVFEIEGEANPLEPENEPVKTAKIEPKEESITRVIEANEEPILPDEQHDDIMVDIAEKNNEPVIEPLDIRLESNEQHPVIEPLDIRLESNEQHDNELNEPIIEPVIESVVEPIKERTPVITTGKVQLEDIKEVKDRGYSVKIPQPKTSNTIERIGSNKVVKNGDNNRVFFKRN